MINMLTWEISKAIMLTENVGSKGYILYNFIAMNFLRKDKNHKGQRTNQWLLEDLRVRGLMERS